MTALQEDAASTWHAPLPAGWKSVHLRRLARMYAGGTPEKSKQEFWTEGSIPWLNSGAVNQGTIKEPSAFITEAAYEASSTKWVPKDALVMALAGQGKTKGMVAQMGIEATCNQSMAAIVPERIHPRFLFYWLTASYRRIRGSASDDLRDGLNLQILGDIPCPVPPAIGTQECIANYLDAQTARIDALILEKDKLLNALVESEASQLLAHLTGQMQGARCALSPEAPAVHQLPAGWKLPQLARLVSKLGNGFVGPTRDILVPAGVRYLQSLHIKSGQIDFSRGEYYVTEEWSRAHAKAILQLGDVLIVQTGDIGQTAVVTDEFVGCSCHALIIATPRRELVLPEFLELVLRSAYGRASFDLYATGALHPHLNCGNIRDIRIPLPPLAVQEQIARACDEVQEAHRGLRMHVAHHIARLSEYRASLISAAVTGQLDVGDHKTWAEGRLAA